MRKYFWEEAGILFRNGNENCRVLEWKWKILHWNEREWGRKTHSRPVEVIKRASAHRIRNAYPLSVILLHIGTKWYGKVTSNHCFDVFTTVIDAVTTPVALLVFDKKAVLSQGNHAMPHVIHLEFRDDFLGADQCYFVNW